MDVGLKTSILKVIFMSILKAFCKRPFGGPVSLFQMAIFGCPFKSPFLKKLDRVKGVGNKNQYWSIHLNMEHWDPKTAG